MHSTLHGSQLCQCHMYKHCGVKKWLYLTVDMVLAEEHSALRTSGSGPLVASAAKSLPSLKPPSTPLSNPPKGPALAQHHHIAASKGAAEPNQAAYATGQTGHQISDVNELYKHGANTWHEDKPWDAQSGQAADHRDADALGDTRHGYAFGNPLRQKSTLAAEMEEDLQQDFIPALPHVIYSEGGEGTVTLLPANALHSWL